MALSRVRLAVAFLVAVAAAFPITVQAGPFTKDTVSGLIGWYDASDINGDGVEDSLPDGSVITTWVDKSDGGFDGVAHSDPTVENSWGEMINRHPVIRFDGDSGGNGDCFDLGDMRTTTGGVHAFVVSRSYETDGLRWQRIVSSKGPTDPNDYQVGGWLRMRPYLDSGDPTVYPWEITQSSYGADKTMHAVRIGAYAGSYSSSCFDGDVAEVLIFDRALSSTEIASVTSYLNDKYIPEPSSFLLMGLGVLGLLARARRRRRP